MFPIPDLDRKDFQQLFREALKKINAYIPDWTNHNYSDPGITILELMLFLTDILYYRLDYIDDEHRKAYLKLLKYHLTGDIKEDFSFFRKNYFQAHSALTEKDLKDLALVITEALVGKVVSRIHIVRNREKNIINIIPIIKEGIIENDVLKALEQALEPCRPISVRLKFNNPTFTPLGVEAGLITKKEVSLPEIEEQIFEVIKEYISPINGLKGTGYPPGRPLYYSEIIALMERVSVVDGVTHIFLDTYSQGLSLPDKVMPKEDSFFYLKSLKLNIISSSKEQSCW